MTKTNTLLLAGLLLSTVSLAQSRNDLQGPKAKNYKYWKHPDRNDVILFTTEASLQGPAAKNQKVWINKQSNTENTHLVDTSAPATKVIGPRAKNSTPWEVEEEEVSIATLQNDKKDKLNNGAN